jgi:hypothetical protein
MKTHPISTALSRASLSFSFLALLTLAIGTTGCGSGGESPATGGVDGGIGSGGNGGGGSGAGGSDMCPENGCPEGQYCSDGVCKPGCADDASCPAGSICKDNACVAGCTVDHACSAGAECCDGQCFDTKADPLHCGGCAACPAPMGAHADAVCDNGVCGFGPCIPGFGDCNGDPTDGCEADLMGASSCACAPGAIVDCYEGPAGTLGLGVCAGGKKTCALNGLGFGPCQGQVLPDVEDCSKPSDEDCNGEVNEAAAGCVCQPGTQQSCYDGPADTDGVGVCHGGMQMCNPDGKGFGPCAGEVVPGLETCATPVDDDCDGQANEEGSECVCPPNSAASCYSGPPDTAGVGACAEGLKQCNGLGTAYGPCVGEILPKPDSCATATDEDCDGSSLTCAGNDGCHAPSGTCQPVCSPIMLGKSNVGCDFYPTVTSTIVSSSFHFAVAVANDGTQDANVTITIGSSSVASGVVTPGDVQIFTLPWVNELKDASSTVLSLASASNGAYRVVSDRPVAVYQYSPIEYVIGNSNSFTNDASLLLPVTAWTGDYRVASRELFTFQNITDYEGFYAITASQDDTTVVLSPSATGGIVKAGGGVAADGTGTIVLDAGDVLQVLTAKNPSGVSDLTGTLVTADKPVQVIGGHDCTFIPANVGYCDHLEESVLPLQALSTSYGIVSPWIDVNTPKAQIVRIVATADNTTLIYDPPQAGAPASIDAAGSYVELAMSSESYIVTASEKIMVIQYMLGQDAGGNKGDPSMSIAVPTNQYRESYLVHAPTNYQSNFIDIVAPTGVEVLLDGVAVPQASFTVIGASGLSAAHAALSNTGNGNHTISSASPVGVSVYGYGQYTTYWYPGGFDVNLDP